MRFGISSHVPRFVFFERRKKTLFPLLLSNTCNVPRQQWIGMRYVGITSFCIVRDEHVGDPKLGQVCLKLVRPAVLHLPFPARALFSWIPVHVSIHEVVVETTEVILYCKNHLASKPRALRRWRPRSVYPPVVTDEELPEGLIALVDWVVRQLCIAIPQISEIEGSQLFLSLHHAKLQGLRGDPKITSRGNGQPLVLWRVFGLWCYRACEMYEAFQISCSPPDAILLCPCQQRQGMFNVVADVIYPVLAQILRNDRCATFCRRCQPFIEIKPVHHLDLGLKRAEHIKHVSTYDRLPVQNGQEVPDGDMMQPLSLWTSQLRWRSEPYLVCGVWLMCLLTMPSWCGTRLSMCVVL